MLRPATLIVLLTPLALVASSSARSATSAPEPVDDGGDASLSSSQSTDRPAQSNSDDDFGPSYGNNDEDQEETNLETGLPLRYLLTPLHWGEHLSLLSATAYEGYNSNPTFEQLPVGSSVTSLSALVLYSRTLAGWRMNFQYQPFLWISSTRTFKDFAAASADVRTLHHINGNWRWTLSDRFRYSPTHSTDEERGFVSQSGGFGFGNVFLSNGRNLLTNSVHGTLIDQYKENSSLTFFANQRFTRLSSFVGSLPFDSLPTQEANTISAGAIWDNRFTARNTLVMRYIYDLQTSTGASAFDVNTHSVTVGMSHQFSRGLSVSVSAGPAWSSYIGETAALGRWRTTAQGGVTLSKQFRRSGALLSFSRSDSFTGIISDSFHNRYDADVYRQFSPRLLGSVTASYIQQQIPSGSNINGLVVVTDIRYFLNPSLALFAEGRYFDLSGSQRLFAPVKSVIVGFRWSWVPERP